MATKLRTHHDYMVGWVCALPEEQTAATALLDQRHDDLSKPRSDPNTYTLGSIGRHNIVIACLPMGKSGTTSAATVASHMISTFPEIRFGLMVGIGGGIPPNVRLGDVVVSVPDGTYPGVVQWDMGKAEQGGKFRRTGALSNPPTSLLTALTKLKTQHDLEGPKISEYLQELEQKWPRLASRIKTDALDDVLFSANYPHASDTKGCQHCDRTQIVTLTPREMRVHYGLIASGNQVIKDAKLRDQISEDLGAMVLAVEMEAAGLMDNFPCIVIRGISDYADSHKNDKWQGYAAVTAAAYTKELLMFVQPDDIDKENTINAELSKISNITLSIKEDITHAKSLLYNKEADHVLDWLTPENYGSQHSDTLKRWHPETNDWFLNSETFQEWVKQINTTLYCPGIPGAGKTIITCTVIEYLSDKFASYSDIVVAYLYCSFKRQEEQTFVHFLASLLRQLIQGRPSLLHIIHDLYRLHKDKGTRPTYHELLTALQSTISRFRRTFFVIDALDECTSKDCRKRLLDQIFQFQTKYMVNVFATSRIREEITTEFDRHDVLQLQISAQDHDLKTYLQDRMIEQNQDLFDGVLRDIVTSKIISATEGMFLLAELHLNALIDLPTKGDIKYALNNLTKGVEKLDFVYKSAMERIEGQGAALNSLAKRIILWVVYTRRPLTTLELQHALAIRPRNDTVDEDFIPSIKKIRSICAGLIAIDESSKIVRLVHYTTQQYFERTKIDWFPDAQKNITEACITYLSFKDFDNEHCESDEEFERRLQDYPFYRYAAQNWGYHAYEIKELQIPTLFLQRKAQIEAASQAMFAVKRYSSSSDYSQLIPRQFTGLHLAAYFGLDAVIQAQASQNELNKQDSYGRMPLSWAAENGHDTVAQRLLDTGLADVDSKDKYGHTPLSRAAEIGHDTVVQQLLDTGLVNVDSKDNRYGRTPLSWAARNGHEVVVQQLLWHSPDYNVIDFGGLSPLGHAVSKNYETIEFILLSAGADSDDDVYGIRALFA